MERRYVPFTSIVVIALILSTGLVVATVFDKGLKSSSIKANLPFESAPMCSSVSGKFNVREVTGIRGTGVNEDELEALKSARDDFLEQREEIVDSIDGLLLCGEGCLEKDILCDFSSIDCHTSKLSDGKIRAFCGADISCVKDCSGTKSE